VVTESARSAAPFDRLIDRRRQRQWPLQPEDASPNLDDMRNRLTALP